MISGFAYHYQDWDSTNGVPRGRACSSREAEARFSVGETVTVLIGNPTTPGVVLQVRQSGHVIVTMWLDQLQRPEVTYVWLQPLGEVWREDVLLHQVVLHEFDHLERPPNASPSRAETTVVWENGDFTSRRVSLATGEEMVSSGHEPEHLQVEKAPVFGAWSPFLDDERTGGDG